ncbi:hypothetical protein WN944_026125 [Citrus x changshan-huyou]|uniref:Uncharacterized protein n=1 Tax=Citrus x changshan-huyou TaxID=2935761 RepID=A0AAP0QHB8_9ROSI
MTSSSRLWNPLLTDTQMLEKIFDGKTKPVSSLGHLEINSFWLLRTSPSTGAESPAGSRVDFPNTVGSSNPNTSPHTKFISKPNKCYNECKLNLDFRKEYIFLGGYIPSLSV